MELGDHADTFQFLIRDRDSKFTAVFDAVFTGANVRIIRTPIRAPQANDVPGRPSTCSDETDSAVSSMSTCRLHEVTRFSHPHAPGRSVCWPAIGSARVVPEQCEPCTGVRNRAVQGTHKRIHALLHRSAQHSRYRP